MELIIVNRIKFHSNFINVKTFLLTPLSSKRALYFSTTFLLSSMLSLICSWYKLVATSPPATNEKPALVERMKATIKIYVEPPRWHFANGVSG